MTDRTRIILEDLEAVRENLLAARPRPRQTHRPKRLPRRRTRMDSIAES